MAPPRPLHCTGAQGPSGAAGQTPQKSNEPSTSEWPMVLPESPLLTFSFALRALSFSHVLTCSAPRPHSPAQYGVSAPFTSTHASTRRGMEEMSRVSQYHRCVRPREQEACTNTSENWRGTCFEHHWPNELLTAARSAAPGRAC